MEQKGPMFLSTARSCSPPTSGVTRLLVLVGARVPASNQLCLFKAGGFLSV